MKKYTEKLVHQAKVNPGHKAKYIQPLRPRSTVFNSKKEYKRDNKVKSEEIYEN